MTEPPVSRTGGAILVAARDRAAEIASAKSPATAAALALGACGLWLLVAGATTLWDRDEPRFARAAVEMLRSGDLLVPTYEGALRPHKPILVYWLMAGAMRVLGPTPLAARLHSPVAAALTLLLVYQAGRTLFSARAGLVAAALLAASPLLLLEATAATTDAVLLLCCTGALAVLADAMTRGTGRRHLFLFAAALALAQLAKGPVGLAVPVLSLLAAVLLSRRSPALAPRTTRAFLLAAAASLAVFLVWAIPADAATKGRLFAEGFGRQVVGRSLAPMEGHGGRFLVSLPYYLPVIAIGFLPGTLFLPGALSALGGGRLGTSDRNPRALLLGWIAAPLLLFTMVATKLPHYALPIWPALALACAGVLDAARQGRLAPPDLLWLRRGVWLYAPLAAGAVFACAILPWRLGLDALKLPGLLLAGLAGVSAVAGVADHLRGRSERGAVVLVGGSAAMTLVVALTVLPVLESMKPVPRLAAAVRAAGAAAAPLATCGFEEPSLTFASGAAEVTHLRAAAEVGVWARAGGDGVLVTTRSELARLATLPLTEIASAEGWNVAKGQRVELVALRRLSR